MFPTGTDAVQRGGSYRWDDLPPVFGNLATKLDSTLTAMKCLSLPQEDVSIKRVLVEELSEVKQEIARTKEYLDLIKEDLAKVKIMTRELTACVDNIEILRPLLPAATEEESLPLDMVVSKRTDIPIIVHLPQKEWKNVPSYLKLRLKGEQVNDFIDVFNKQLIHKYTFLKKKQSTLNRNDIAVWKAYKALETVDTKGHYFLVASDLTPAGKSERTLSVMSGILRHCRRLREIRTGKIIRYVVVKA